MPHIIVKLISGKAETKKKQLAERITEAVTGVLDYGDESVSVSIEEIAQEDWKAKVYEPDIQNGPGTLYKAPGYTM